MSCTAPRHGTAGAYTGAGCRCATAREAWRLYNKRRREGRQPSGFIDATGSIRRIRALIALGWNFRALAREAGYSVRTVQDVGYARRSIVTRHTARWVADLYERLSATPGGSKYALTVAARYDWAPPLAWDDDTIDDPNAQPDRGDTTPTDLVDEVAVRRALAGDRVQLTRAERVRAVQVGLDANLTAAELARRLRISGTRALEIARHIRTQAA